MGNNKICPNCGSAYTRILCVTNSGEVRYTCGKCGCIFV